MKITIEQATNGYVVTYPDYVVDENNSEKEVFNSLVIEEDEHDEFGEQKAFAALCWKIHELFGIQWNKHASRQLRIELTGEDEKADDNG